MSKTINIILLTILFSAYSCNAQTELPPITDEMIKQCEESNSCDNIPGYPGEIIDKIIKEAGEPFNSLFFKDEKPTPTRRDDVGFKVDFCNAKEEIITPQMSMNKQGKWVYLANSKGEQSYRIQSCINPGQSCSKVLVPIEGHNTKCEQKYFYREGVTIQDNKPVLDQIRVKSCCNCVLLN